MRFRDCPHCDASGIDDTYSAITGELQPCTACTGEGRVEREEPASPEDGRRALVEEVPLRAS